MAKLFKDYLNSLYLISAAAVFLVGCLLVSYMVWDNTQRINVIEEKTAVIRFTKADGELLKKLVADNKVETLKNRGNQTDMLGRLDRIEKLLNMP